MKRALVATVMLIAGGCAKNIPPPSVAITKDEAQLAKGKYLVTAGMACVACHSRRDWTKYGGPPVEGSELGGSDDVAKEDHLPAGFSFTAPNLTPHRLKDWSDGEIVRATILGQSKDGRGLFPLMPYFIWRDNVALDDAAAVVAYLRTVPSIERDDPAPQFPIPGFVMNGFPQPRELRATAPKLGDADYGKYVTMRAACLECHTGADDKGRLVGVPFAGGREFELPAPGKGFIHSSNLTPDNETGLGGWSMEMFVGRFKAATLEAARNTPVGDDGYNTVMPWWAYASLSDEDLGAIFDFLHALPPSKNAVPKLTPASTRAP